jgi:spore coat polysaccharide biosynthesis protein SpsF (cytidylyltransferase family)
MKVVGIIQARVGSTRLPGKVLRVLHGKPMLAQMIDRVTQSKTLDTIVLATTVKPEDDAVEILANELGIICYRGSEIDVLDRYYQAALEARADVVARLTGDCPLHDPIVIDGVVSRYLGAKGEVSYIGAPSNYPEGFDTEVFSFPALEDSWREAMLPSEREHVTQFIQKHPERFATESWTHGAEDNSSMHFSVDTEADFLLAESVYDHLYTPTKTFTMHDVLALVAVEPELLAINAGATGYEGLAKSLKEDDEFLNHS